VHSKPESSKSPRKRLSSNKKGKEAYRADIRTSAVHDILDDIYSGKDPIGKSLAMRKKEGAIVCTVPNYVSHSGKYYFTLRQEGQEPELKPVAKPHR